MRTTTAFVGVAAALTILASGCGSSGSSTSAAPDDPVVPSPIPDEAPTTSQAGSPIPEGVLPIEMVAAQPAADPDVRYTRSDGADLPTHLSPCRTKLASDRDRVAGRQIVVAPVTREQINGQPRVWKSQRLVIYRDSTAAAAAVAELRTALARCARHDEGGGVTTVWRVQPHSIGDEALRISAQMQRGETALRGHYRGIVMRHDRAVMTSLDFGPGTEAIQAGETTEQEKDAREVARRLADAAWLREV